MKGIILVISLLGVPIWAMDLVHHSRSANVVAPLKVLAAACVSKKSGHDLEIALDRLPVELRNLLAHCAKWNTLTSQSFPAIPLPVKYATMSPDTSTIAGIAQDPDGSSKLRFITFCQEREDKSCNKFPQDLIPTAAAEDRIVNLAFHPTKQKIALVGSTPNVTLIEACENNLLNVGGRYTAQRAARLSILQWNPHGDTLLAAGDNIIFIIPEDSNEQVEEIIFHGNGSINAALWSPSGKKILVKLGMYGVKVIDWENRCVEAEFAFESHVPVTAVEWDDEEQHTILLAQKRILEKLNYHGKHFEDHEYYDPTGCIEQILPLHDNYLLIKKAEYNKHNLYILDRIQKKVFQLPHVTCNGTLTLSADKRFVYGSSVGDSVVDLSYLLDNQLISKLPEQP